MELTKEGKRGLAKLGALRKASPDLAFRLEKEIGKDAEKEVIIRTPRLSDSMVSTVRSEINRRLHTITIKVGGMMAKFSRAGFKRNFVDYACVFDAHTKIITDQGYKSIGQIKEGDFVLTQTGEYHKVIGKTNFATKFKPYLIDIETTYRKNKNHKLTVTLDHKMLVWRDGRNKWIHAGELKKSDELYTRIKIAHNKDTSKIKICQNCKKKFIGQGIKYCSLKCRNEIYTSNKNPNIGSKRTKATKENISKSKREFYKLHPEKHVNSIISKKGYVTSYEKKIKLWLEKRRIEFIQQYRIGKYYCDFYLPKTNEIIEADGGYWHQDQKKDIIRDKELLKLNPNLIITHIHFYDKRFSSIKDSNPLPNVYYSVCNPGTQSFIDLKTFKRTKILKLKKWKYNKGGAKLYDLTIDKVHSFYANGIIISNSYVEEGHKTRGDGRVSGVHMLVRGVNAALVKKNSIARQAFNSWIGKFK